MTERDGFDYRIRAQPPCEAIRDFLEQWDAQVPGPPAVSGGVARAIGHLRWTLQDRCTDPTTPRPGEAATPTEDR